VSTTEPEFDAFAEGYDEALQQGLDLTGESKEFFAAGRIEWLKSRLKLISAQPDSILDFGCGTGGSIPYLLTGFSPQKIVGTDVSEDSLKIARTTHDANICHFEILNDYHPTAELDLAFCNGVFHHIPLPERQKCVDTIFQSLRSDGLFCFWENNPWNPGTRWVMSRVPFDRDAIMVWPHEARRLLRTSGFEIISTTYRFFFPNSLRAFRPLENSLYRIPLGGQYMVLARKPA
jgi:SAM-dependent methyltransferase